MEKWITRQVEEGTFVLNTKTVCFLCLQDVESPKKVTGGIDLTTAAIKVEPEGVGEAGSVDGKLSEVVSLLSIASYLKIRCSEIFNSVLGRGTAEEELLFERISSFSVTLCGNGCTAAVLKLTELCVELEELQNTTDCDTSTKKGALELELIRMKLNHRLQNFKVVLETSEGDRDLSDDFRDKLTKPVEMVNGNLAETLRKELILKCSEQLRSTFPKVILPRLNKNELESSATSSPSQPFKIHKSLPITVSTPPKITLSLPITSLQTSTKQKFNYSAVKCEDLPPPDNFRRYTCTLCLPPRRVRLDQEPQHKAVAHLPIIFASSKLPHLSPDNFKIYCKHLIKKEIRSALKLKKKTAKGRPFLQCPHCPSSFAYNVNMHTHLVQNHASILEEKLVQLQRSTPLEELKSVHIPLLMQKESWKCRGGCGKTFSSKSGLFSHKKRECPCPASKTGRKRWCEFCGDLVPSTSYWRHKKYSCPGLLQGSSSPSKKTEDKVVRVNCDLCGVLINASRLTRHKKFICEFGPNLNPKLRCELCGEYFKMDYLLQVHRKEVHPSGGKTHKCAHCGKSFRHYSSLWLHRKTIHSGGERQPSRRGQHWRKSVPESGQDLGKAGGDVSKESVSIKTEVNTVTD